MIGFEPVIVDDHFSSWFHFYFGVVGSLQVKDGEWSAPMGAEFWIFTTKVVFVQENLLSFMVGMRLCLLLTVVVLFGFSSGFQIVLDGQLSCGSKFFLEALDEFVSRMESS